MCAPVAAPVALGALSAGTGVLGAYGQYQNQNAQVAAANKANIKNYKYQLKMRERAWDRERYMYGMQVHEYKNQLTENNSAAQRAYASEQRKLNEVYTGAALSNQAMAVDLLKSSGRQAAKGYVSGKSADRIDAAMISAFGRNQAVLAESLTSARQSAKLTSNNIRAELMNANRQAYSQVAINPVPTMGPPKPTMQQGPGPWGLLTGVAQAGLEGYGTYKSLKAPDAYVPLI